MGLHKIFKIVALVLGLAGVVLWGMLVAKGDEAVVASGGEGLDPFLYVAYITFAILLVLVILFVLKGLADGDIKKTLMSVGAFVLVFVIAYVMAEGVESYTKDGELVTVQTSRYIGTGLYAFYILAILAVVTMAFSGVKKLTTR
jgi:cytochrome bd-type quinol oxidase subunit 2